MAGQNISNKSGIRPIEYNILVAPKEIERKTKGGLLLAETTIEKEEFGRTEGLIVDVSPMAFTFADWPADAPKPRIGDRVMFSKYQAQSVKGRDGKDYWIIKDKSLMAVIEDMDE